MVEIYEGTAEEIAEQLRQGNHSGRLRAIVGPVETVEPHEDDEMGETLLERLKGRIGRFDFGGANLSEDTSRKFTELLVAKYRAEQEAK